jgi:hypothetical protein
MLGKVAAAGEVEVLDDIPYFSAHAVMGSKHCNRRNMRSNTQRRNIDIGRDRRGERPQ